VLKSTFCCFRGISQSGECRLWEQGIESWAHVISREPIFSKSKWKLLLTEIALAEQALASGLADFFLNRLKGLHRARILSDFQGQMVFLDIETDGIGRDARVTTIALYRGSKVHVFVRGHNLCDFVTASASCGIWVTYNGARFDLPILRREFGLDLTQPHLDLMPILRGMGSRGGLKQCEKALGYERQTSAGITGLDAVELWRQYDECSDERALNTLIRYNCEDVLSLEWLLIRAYNESMSGFPFNIRRKLPDAGYSRKILQDIVL